MLILIIHTINYGKFVLFKYPYQKIQIENQSFEKLALNDVLESITNTFDYFAIYRKHSLISTSNGALPEKAVVEMFMANQKCSQVVMGIDDDCVLVTRSAFFSNRIASAVAESESFSDSASIMDLPQIGKSQVISVSLIWRQDSFNQLEGTKHRLSFLLGLLERKEQHEQFLTKEIIRIMEEKQRLKRRIKDLLSSNIKQNAMTLEEIRMKLLAREIQAMAKNMRDQLPLFNFLQQYYETWVKGETFELKEYNNSMSWSGTIGKQVVVGLPPPQFCQQIKHKSLVILPPKLGELSCALYSDRVRSLYEKGFSHTHLSINKLLQTNRQIEPQELFHTAYFLLRNKLAVDIYPINNPHSYNLFYLKDLPQRSLIQKFNNKIFPGKNFLEVINQYSKYKLALKQQQTLKYLLLKGIVGQVQIFIYRKASHLQYDKLRPSEQGIFVNMLQKYSLVDRNFNELLSTEPLGNKDLLSNVIKFMKNHPKEWGFFFVQRT